MNFKIKNVTWIKNYDSDQLKIKSATPRVSRSPTKYDNGMYYDTTMWNPIHFSIYFERYEITKLLLETYTVNYILAMRLPPPNEYIEYIIPGTRNAG